MAGLREVFAELGFDLDANSIAAAEAALDVLKNGLTAVAGGFLAAGAALAGMVGMTVHTASELNDMSQRTGVSTDALQTMGYAAKLSGVSMGELAQGLNFLARKGVKDIQGEMLKLADRFQHMEAGGARAKLAMELFGRSGARMLPMFERGAAGLAEMAEEARQFGIMSEEHIRAGDEMGDNIDRVTFAFKGLAFAIAEPLIGPLSEVTHAFALWVAVNRKFISARVHEAIAFVGKALYVAQRFFEPIRRVMEALASHAGLLKVALIGLGLYVGSVLGGMVVAALGSLAAWLAAATVAIGGFTVATALATAAAFLFNLMVFGLAAAALLALEDLYTFFKGGRSLIGTLGVEYTNWLDDVLKPRPGPLAWLIDPFKFLLRILFDIQGAFEQLGHWLDKSDGFKAIERQNQKDRERVRLSGRTEYEKANGLFADLARFDDPAVRALEPERRGMPKGSFGPEAPPYNPPVAYQSLPGPVAPVAQFNAPFAPITINPPPGSSPDDIGVAVAGHVERLWEQKIGEGYATVDPHAG